MPTHLIKSKKNLNYSSKDSVFQMQASDKSNFQLKDNRPETTSQRRLRKIARKNEHAPLLKATIGQNISENRTVQMVAIKQPWLTQKAHYESHKVGHARLDGDALWLAMTRFAKDVPEDFKATHTVEQVLAEASKIKKVSFDDWKGHQADGTSQEAQHLVTSTFATTVLRWPYSEINCEDNGKMLLAGRGGKGTDTSGAYKKAKRERHPWAASFPIFSSAAEPARGYRHIGSKGFTHPRYSAMSEAYVRDYYSRNGLTIGQPIAHEHAKAIKQGLREWHKHGDRSSHSTIDEKAFSAPIGQESGCFVM